MKARGPVFALVAASITAGLVLTSCGGGSGTGGDHGGSGDSLTGARLPSQGEVDGAPAPLSFGSGALPTAVDLAYLRTLPPVRSQSLQDCIAFAFGYGLASFEVATSVGFNADQISHQASPSDLYAKLLKRENEACDSGTSASDAMDILVQSGVQSLAAAPYDGTCVNPSSGGTFGILGYHLIRPADTDSIKQVLADHHPVGMAISLYPDMSDWGKTHHDDSVYTGTGTPSATNGHGMLFVGYDDAKRAWKVMNSWGTNWGNAGFFWMAYDTFAASGRVCYSVDGGGTAGGQDSGFPVTFVGLKALQYFSKKDPVSYLVMPFQFDHAAHILQARLISQITHAATPWQSIDQWLTKSYLWWASASPFPAGSYTLELQCQTSSGHSYTLSQSAVMSFGGYTRATGIHGNAEASHYTLSPLLALDRARSAFAIGDSVMANGHMVSIADAP